MGAMGIGHWLVVGALVLLFFGGRGKISEMMGDMAKGIKAFKKGMSDEDAAPAAASVVTPAAPIEPRTLDHQTASGQAAPSTTLADRKLG